MNEVIGFLEGFLVFIDKLFIMSVYKYFYLYIIVIIVSIFIDFTKKKMFFSFISSVFLCSLVYIKFNGGYEITMGILSNIKIGFALIFINWIIMLVYGFISFYFEDMEDKKQAKIDELEKLEYEVNQERERHILLSKEIEEENAYQKQLKRKLDERRAELKIEFEHLERILRLQGSIDEAKMRKISELKNESKNAQERELDLIQRQIEALKNL